MDIRYHSQELINTTKTILKQGDCRDIDCGVCFLVDRLNLCAECARAIGTSSKPLKVRIAAVKYLEEHKEGNDVLEEVQD